METQQCIQVGDLSFSYKEKILAPIEDNHWIWVYEKVTLNTGEYVGQISIEYNFTGDKRDGSNISVYFETDDGDVHDVQSWQQLRN